MTGGETICTQFVSREEWPGIAGTFADYNYEQSYDYSTAMAIESGGVAKFLAMRHGGRLVGAASVRIRHIPLLNRGVAYVPNGPLVHPRDDGASFELGRLQTVVGALKAKLVDEQGHNLYIRPGATPPVDITRLDTAFLSAGFRKSDHLRCYNTVLMDLSADAIHLRQELHRKWRYNLARSEKEDLRIELGTDDRYLEQFAHVYEEMKRNKGFHSASTPQVFFRLPREDVGLTVLIAQRDGQPVGGGVLSILGNTAVDLFAATTDTGRNSRAGYLLYWTAMLYAKDHGCRWYDLGGIDRATNPGNFVFKTQMGGRLVEGLCGYEARPEGLAATLTDKLLMLRNRLKGR